MENASKALLIAASVLIVILIVAVGVKITSSADGIKGTAQDTGKVINDKTGDATDIAIEKINGSQEDKRETISEDESYVGCYVDFENDGTLDGIIYNDNKTGSKEYYISQKNVEGDFGTKDVITSNDKSIGIDNPRFYIMALTDVDGQQNGTRYCWYHAAYGKIDNNKIPTSEEFGTGRNNTLTMIQKWNDGEYTPLNGHEEYKDVWGEIQEQVAKGWFIPSKDEWHEFIQNLDTVKNNYNGISNFYWTSSQVSTTHVWRFTPNTSKNSTGFLMDYANYVRLSTTF